MPPLVIENLDALSDFVGREISVSDWFEITQERILKFAETTEDRQWIHLDPVRTKRESPYGATIAHGFLTLSLLPELWFELFGDGGYSLTVNYGVNRVRFPAPVPVGSRVRASFKVEDVEQVLGGE